MEARFSLLDGRGWLAVREQGGRVDCKGEIPDDKTGLYKGWLTGPGGRALLGTFMPEGAALRLSRTLSAAELERQGAWPPVAGEALMAYPFGTARRERRIPAGWRWEERPARLMGEPLLAGAAGQSGALLQNNCEGFSLAYPFDSGRPFPLTPLFCFARVEALEGEPYLLFPFRPGGCPRLE